MSVNALRGLLLFSATLFICSPARAADDSKIRSLIVNLSADDAASRQSAADSLVLLGAAARPAVLSAAHSDDPEISASAAQVLLKLPWSDPADPPTVRDILDQYATYHEAGIAPADLPPPSEDNRKAAAAALAQLPDFAGFPALVRLVYEEPSNSVRWAIVHELRTNDDGFHLISLRKADAVASNAAGTPASDPPLTALRSLAWLSSNPAKAQPLLRQAMDDELKQPSDSAGELDFLVDRLVDLDESSRDFDAAAKLLRGQLQRDPQKDYLNVPLPLLRLFTLHADHGPLPGFDDDKKLAADFLSTPKLQYTMARIDLKLNQPDAAAAAKHAAFAAGGSSRLGRFDVGRFLADNGWDDEADAEFRAYLAMPPGDDQADGEASETNAHFNLAALAVRREDFLEAAEQQKTAMSIIGGGTQQDLQTTDRLGHVWKTKEQDIWAGIDWLYLRAAEKAKNEAAISAHLEELLNIAPTDEDIAIDVVPLLQQRKQPDQAKAFFDTAHKAAAAKLAADPTSPALMNGLAWLDAKCDQNMDEALQMATAAVAALPDDAAVIDTLAEVNFHLGNYAKSAELETKALQILPGDKFMTGQLERFKQAAGK